MYGAKVAETSREEACRDTELAVPVGPLDKEAMRSPSRRLTGKGRTPIGNSLLAVPDDLGRSEGRRTRDARLRRRRQLRAAGPVRGRAQVSEQGMDLSISVVGLQVNERVRRQLECIAKAGGGTYVGVQDADELADELAAAALAGVPQLRAGRDEGHGRAGERQAAVIQAGLFQDAIRPGETRWYAVDVPEGRASAASVSAIPSFEDAGQSALRTELLDTNLAARGGRLARSCYGAAAGEGGRVRAQSLLMPDFAGTEELPPGRYTFSVEIEDGLETDAVPVEIGVQLLGRRGTRPDARGG